MDNLMEVRALSIYVLIYVCICIPVLGQKQIRCCQTFFDTLAPQNNRFKSPVFKICFLIPETCQ